MVLSLSTCHHCCLHTTPLRAARAPLPLPTRLVQVLTSVPTECFLVIPFLFKGKACHRTLSWLQPLWPYTAPEGHPRHLPLTAHNAPFLVLLCLRAGAVSTYSCGCIQYRCCWECSGWCPNPHRHTTFL